MTCASLLAVAPHQFSLQTWGMARYIRLAIESAMTDEEYANLANAAWMVLRNTKRDFHIEHDGKTDSSVLNRAWAQYGDDATWE